MHIYSQIGQPDHGKHNRTRLLRTQEKPIPPSVEFHRDGVGAKAAGGCHCDSAPGVWRLYCLHVLRGHYGFCPGNSRSRRLLSVVLQRPLWRHSPYCLLEANSVVSRSIVPNNFAALNPCKCALKNAHQHVH